MVQRATIPFVLSQHTEELAILWGARQVQAMAGHTALRHLARFDRRIAAHQDGCLVAGADGVRALEERLLEPNAGSVFAAVVVALAGSERSAVDRCLAAAAAVPECVPGVLSALGWVSREQLAGIGRDLLVAPVPFRRRLGLAACRLHRVDPGQALTAGLRDADPGVRAEALRTAGDLGRRDLLTTLTAAFDDEDADCRFWGARSLVLLGDRVRALAVLAQAGAADGRHQTRAFRLVLQALPPDKGHGILQQFSAEPARLRSLVQGSGIVGDPGYVPWLVKQMSDRKMMRAAGEAFSLITGADLAWLDLEQRPPENAESGPNDNPEDDNVDMDPDEGLPWPDPGRVQRWWDANGERFQPGTRYFMGAPATREHCLDVLRDGYQRQRILAAHYLCLLQPGTPLFNTSAPAWRQQRWLAQMA